MGTPVSVLHVRDGQKSRPSWYDHEGIDPVTVDDEFDPGSAEGIDCAVVEESDGLDAVAVLRGLRSAAPDAPVVVCDPDAGERDPLVVGFDGDVPESLSRSEGTAFAAGLRDLAARTRSPDEMAKTDALHDAAMELVYCETEAEVFEYGVEAATNLLELEQATIYTVDGSELVPAAIAGEEVVPTSEVAVFDVDEGGVGHVYQTGESLVVEDAFDHDVAKPSAESIRSGVCVSLGETGVFVAIDDEVGAFDERDRTLLEILGAHVRTALDRVRTRSEIERERDRFRALFEHVPDPLVVAEPTAAGPRIRHANPAFEDVFGVDAGEAEGEVIGEYVGLPEGAEQVDIPEDGHTVTEVRREANGEVRTFLFRGFPVRIGDETRHVAFFTDVTERKRRRRELERKTERLEEFASIVSHDLRNPLGVARGWVEQGLDDPDHAERALEEVDVSLDRMQSLVEDLLSLSREGWSVDGMVPVEAEPLVRRAWDGTDTGDATLRVEWGGTVAADRDMAVELFENLFRNAVEHGSTNDRRSEDAADAVEHGGGVTVTVGSLPGEEGVYVADDGTGIDPELRESVFEMGVTSDDAGTGLGLAIVDRIAEAHGWDVSVTDSDDGGARFEIRFEPDGS